MISRYSVFCEGQEYVLLCNFTGAAAKSWAWVDGRSSERVSLADVERLRDSFLAQEPGLGKPQTPRELRRLYEVLRSMGAPEGLILRRLGPHVPRKCVDCKKLTTGGYAGPRCDSCHEQFVRTGRVRNAAHRDSSRKSRGSRRR
jgi:hypothetical protein